MVVMHAFNASVQKAKATRSLSWSTEQVAGEPGARTTQRISSPKKKKERKKEEEKKGLPEVCKLFILILLHHHHHKNMQSSSAMLAPMEPFLSNTVGRDWSG